MFTNLFSLHRDGKYEWEKFRNLSKLDKKFDETLTEYYKAFQSMCRRVCGKKLTEEDGEFFFCTF